MCKTSLGGGGLHDRFRHPWLQTTITRQLEILVTTLQQNKALQTIKNKNVIFCYFICAAAHSVDTAIS